MFAAYNFLIFLHTQINEPKISKKIISEYFGKGVLIFNKIFGADICENLLAAKIERNCT